MDTVVACQAIVSIQANAAEMLGQIRGLRDRFRHDNVVFLTGAGISAESGIPTFRGSDGYWTTGSANYVPTEIATRRSFESMSDVVWSWTLHLRGFCNAAQPNAAHLALADLERQLGDRFLLITSNIDELHRRAGNTRILEIHGNANLMRCWAECTGYDSATEAAKRARGFATVGCSGATNLPQRLTYLASGAQAVMIDINPETNRFSQLAEASGGGWLRQPAATGVVELRDLMTES